MSEKLIYYERTVNRKCYAFSLITFFTVVLFSLFLSETIEAQQIRTSFNLKNISVKQLINEIKVKYDYDFIYSDVGLETIPRKDVVFKSATIEEVLNYFFKNSAFTYEISNKTIILKKISISDPTTKTITGTIQDVNGNALPGVTIIAKGTKTGVISGVDGSFKLDVTDENPVLIFTHVGMKKVEKKCIVGQPVKIIMTEDESIIKDLVFVGYFTANKSTYTGSATTITKDAIEKISSSNVFSVIQSLEPSFKILEDNMQGSNPNSMPNFEVRGKSSIGELESEYMANPNQPLFILDGFETTIEKIFDMDPNLIERISILKDASATAVYGSRAMNGVVVIETIKPLKNRLYLSYNFNGKFEIPDISSYTLCNSEEKLLVENMSGMHKEWSEIENDRRRNMLSGINTDWIAQPLNKVAFSQRHSVGLSGGDNVFQYSFNASINPIKGVLINSLRNRNTVDVTLNYRNKNFSFRIKSSNDCVKSNESDYGTFNLYTLLNPYYRKTDDDGDYTYMLDTFPEQGGRSTLITNPLSNTRLKNIDQMSYTTFRQDAEVSYRFLKCFLLRASGSVAITKRDNQVFKSAYHTEFYETLSADPNGSYSNSGDKTITYEGYISLNHNWNLKNEHFISTNLAGTIQSSNLNQFGFKVVGFPSDDLDNISFGLQYSSKKATGINSVSRSAGLFITSNYSFQGRYFTDLSFRTDASSKFGEDRKWAPFWSIGVGWNIHNEPFLKEIKEISRIKIRASYGIVGSQNFNPYQAISTYYYAFDDRYASYSYGVLLKAMGNPDLKWQAANKLNIGLESSLFDNWISFRADYYRSTSKNLLVDMGLPMSSGFNSYKTNLGSVLNKGYEFNFIGYFMKKENKSISLSINGTHNEDILLKLSDSILAWNETQDQAGDNKLKARYISGESINTIWVVRSLGIDPATGKEVFLDINDNKTFDWDPANYYPFKNKEPKLFGNMSLNFNYKGISVNAYANYSFGGYAYNQTLVSKVENADKRLNVDRRMLMGSWKEPGDVTFFRALSITGPTRPTSRFVQKNNYLNMTSLNIGYQIQNKKFLKKLRMEFLKCSLYMNDIFYLSTIMRERGTAYPYSRTISLNIQTRF